jgi:hypothetical protein
MHHTLRGIQILIIVLSIEIQDEGLLLGPLLEE